MSCAIVFDDRRHLLTPAHEGVPGREATSNTPCLHLSHAFPGLLPVDHTDRFEQNPLLDRLGLDVVAFSQGKLFAQPGG
jgi:hypothetical protein